MNLLLPARTGLCLRSTAVAMPIDLLPCGGHGVELDNDAVHAHVLGRDWRDQLARRAQAKVAAGQAAAPAAEPIVQRRQWVQGRSDALDLATLAADRALSAAKLVAGQLAAVICITSTPPRISSAMAARIGRELGCDDSLLNACCFDVRAGGVGALLAWFTAQGLLSQGAGPVLLVAAEAASRFLAPGDLGSALLYGDGAGACILTNGGRSGGFLGGMSGQTRLGGQPTTIPGELPPNPSSEQIDYRFQKPDATHVAELFELWQQFPQELANRFSSARNQVCHFLPYAVSARQIEAARQALGNPHAEVFHELATHGCLGAASSLAALHGLRASGRASAGDVIALAAAAGNGLWGGLFWQLEEDGMMPR